MFGKRIMKWLLAGLIAMSLSVPLSASAETEDAPADPVEKKLTVSAGGKKTALLSIPQRNMHTAVEVIDLDDIESTAQLMAAYILSREGAKNA